MDFLDFVFVEDVAVGFLFADGDCTRFCGASQSLEAIEDFIFDDAQKAKAFITSHLSHASTDGAEKISRK